MLAEDNKSCVITSCASHTVIQKPTGHIGTTGFPNLSYASNTNCTWIIDLPIRFKSIELKFDGVFIEESPNCTNDRLTVLNGKDEDSLLMASYCGSQLPSVIQSSTGAVTIKFISDGTVNQKGFSLHYKGLKQQAKGITSLVAN